MKKPPGIIAVDLDKTLAWYHEGWQARLIGKPIPEMLMRIKTWLRQGKTVVIFSARVWYGDSKGVVRTKAEANQQDHMIRAWCRKHIGQELEVTNEKHPNMIEFWDDRAVQLEPNTGRPINPAHR